VCSSSCACANGFAAIAPVPVASSPNGCPLSLPPGHGARCDLLSTLRTSAWP
jgi:hypothetical protein